jgi:hypothetical protein
MSVNINLSVLAIIVAAAAAMYFLYRIAQQVTRSAARVEEVIARLMTEVAGARQEVKDLRALIAQVTSGSVATELQTNLVALPKIFEAILKLGEIQFESAKKIGQAAKQLAPSRPMPAQDVESADREYRIQSRMREGVSRGQAELELNPANDASVWKDFDFGGTL